MRMQRKIKVKITKELSEEVEILKEENKMHIIQIEELNVIVKEIVEKINTAPQEKKEPVNSKVIQFNEKYRSHQIKL